jgi:DNA-binding CsgD family transcriptional regulator
MILLVSILTIVMAVVAGAYSIALLNNLRKKYPSDPLNSFFYYQILVFTFGIYGVIGSHLVSKILLKFELNVSDIETVTLFLPFLGVPFLIAAWFLYIKTVLGLLGKNIPLYLVYTYFFITTGVFLTYGLVLRYRLSDSELKLNNISQVIRILYYSIEIFINALVALAFMINAAFKKSKKEKAFLKYFSMTALGIVLLKAFLLHFSTNYWIARVYFLLIYFGGSLPLIFILKLHPFKLTNLASNYTAMSSDLYEKYLITPREKEIIEEICKGKSNQQIADDLYITLQTVKDHTHSIFKKVNVQNRVQLTRMFSGKNF